jgi:hypothetical protein
MRLIFLTAGFLAAYAWTRWFLRGREANRPVLHETGIVVVGLLVVAALWAYNDLLFRMRVEVAEFLGHLPLDAGLVGIALGYVAADQQSGAERAAHQVRAPQHGRPAGEGVPAAAAGGGPAATLLSTFKAAAPNLALLAMAVAALVPPTTWREAAGRIQGVKAAGIEISLGSATGANLAQAIRSNEVQRDPLGNSNDRDRSGFTRPRLGRMQSLTEPPMLPAAAHPAATGDADHLSDNATALIFSELPEPGQTGAAAGPAVRHIRRDRAIILHLAAGERARDTRGAADRGGPAWPAAGTPESDELQEFLGGLGAAQERLPHHLAPHCAASRSS